MSTMTKKPMARAKLASWLSDVRGIGMRVFYLSATETSRGTGLEAFFEAFAKAENFEFLDMSDIASCDHATKHAKFATISDKFSRSAPDETAPLLVVGYHHEGLPSPFWDRIHNLDVF